MAWLRNCPSCGPCGGRWSAAQSQQPWFGFNGPLSAESAATGGLCDPDTCAYGGWKYLSRSASASASWSGIAQVWVWHGGWSLQVQAGSYSGSYAETRTINPRSGCQTLTITTPATNDYSPGWGDCSAGAPPVLLFIDPIECDLGFGRIVFDHWITLIASLGFSCGLYNGSAGACTGYDGSTGGTAADVAAYYGGYDFIFDTITDDGTTAHIGIHGIYLRSIPGYHYIGPYDTTHPPPPNQGLDGSGNPIPWPDGKTFCAQVDLTAQMDVDVNWSSPHTGADCIDLCEELLGHWDLCQHGWYDMPTCPRGGFESDYSPPIELLYFQQDCITNPPDPPVVYTTVGAGGNELLTWGAFIRFDPSGDVFSMQKWGFRQGDFLPYGYQDGAAKTWRYLYQQWSLDICTGTGTYGCENKTGAKGRQIIISPNGDCLPGADSYWFTGTFTPERTQGNLWQAVVTDAARDTYPDCYPAASTDTFVEPKDCACVCPTDAACNRYYAGRCPFEPDDTNV